MLRNFILRSDGNNYHSNYFFTPHVANFYTCSIENRQKRAQYRNTYPLKVQLTTIDVGELPGLASRGLAVQRISINSVFLLILIWHASSNVYIILYPVACTFYLTKPSWLF